MNKDLSTQHLQWFIHLRWAAVIGGFLIVGIGASVAPIHLSIGTLLGSLLLLGALNGVYQYLLRHWSNAGLSLEGLKEKIQSLFHIQMILDFAVLTFMLGVSGGVQNPLFLF